MPVPTYDQFIEPLMRYLGQHPGGAVAREAHEAVADALGLSEADRGELVPSGTQPIYKNRVPVGRTIGSSVRAFPALQGEGSGS